MVITTYPENCWYRLFKRQTIGLVLSSVNSGKIVGFEEIMKNNRRIRV